MYKTVKTKATHQAKGKDPSQKNPPKKNLSKQNPLLEPQVVVVPIDQAQNQALTNQQNPPDTDPHCTYQNLHHYQTFQHIYQIPPTTPSSAYVKPSSTCTRP